MNKYVTFEEACVAGKFLLKFDMDKLSIHNLQGSTNVLAARLMGLDFPSYCRMCRDVFEAELHSRTGYPIIYFKKNALSMKLIEILNKRIECALLLKEKEKNV